MKNSLFLRLAAPPQPVPGAQWTGITSLIFANVVAFVMAGVVMFMVAWLIERLVLRHLVNQEGATLLMAHTWDCLLS